MPSLIKKAISQRSRKSALISLSARELLARARAESTELETLLDIAHELTHRSTNIAAEAMSEVNALVSSLLSMPKVRPSDPSHPSPDSSYQIFNKLAVAQATIAELEARLLAERRESREALQKKIELLTKQQKHEEALRKQIQELNLEHARQLSTAEKTLRRELKAADEKFGKWREKFKFDFQEKLKKDREADRQIIRELEKRIEELEIFYEPKNPTREEATHAEAYKKERQRNINAEKLDQEVVYKKKKASRRSRKCECNGEVPNCNWCYGRGFYFIDGFGEPVP